MPSGKSVIQETEVMCGQQHNCRLFKIHYFLVVEKDDIYYCSMDSILSLLSHFSDKSESSGTDGISSAELQCAIIEYEQIDRMKDQDCYDNEPTSQFVKEIVREEIHSDHIDDTSTLEVELDSDTAWGTQEEFESIKNHKLCIEVEKKTEYKEIDGNRIVNLAHVLDWTLSLQVTHSKICTCGQLYLWKEERDGFVSHLFFKCTMCNRIVKKSTYPDQVVQNQPRTCHQEYPVNIGAVWGSLSTGSCHSHLEEICSLMGIPPMTYKKFHKIEENLGNCWHEKMLEEFTKAGKEEAEIAVNAGKVDPDGIPFITVYLDGGWSKRSYGHSYDASSGTAIIIGKATNKALFMGVRNKFCYVCSLASKNKKKANEHICFRNWNSSSSSMEADIIVEGFNKSIEMHGIRYKYFIADGDSSTFAKLRTKVTYGNIIKKIECKNHIFKNYGKHLRNTKADKRIVSTKNYLTEAIMKKLVNLAKQQLHHNHVHGTVDSLKEDLANGPYHIFGQHINCQPYYCTNETRQDIKSNSVDDMKACGLFQRIEGCVDTLIKKANLMFDNETNNRAELFMSLLSKFNAGKRLNLTMKGSFETRCTATSLQYNDGPEWHINAWRSAVKKTPTKSLKLLVARKNRILEYRKNHPTCRKSLFSHKPEKDDNNTDYGIHALEPELSESDMAKEKERVLTKMQVSPEERTTIERNTVGQWGNVTYEQERQNRLTASLFGKIIKRRPTTPCHSDVKSILYTSGFSNNSTHYGIINEKVAVKKFSETYGIDVQPSGLFIDTEHGYLAASPDGLVGDKGLIEVKCLYSIFKAGLTLKEAAQQKNICLELVDDEQLRLKRNDNYYYQVQGQLNITERQFCYFVVYVDEKTDLFVELIQKDVKFWREKMLPNLQVFYLENVLPEIIRRNIPKGLLCENSERIKKSIQARQAIISSKVKVKTK